MTPLRSRSQSLAKQQGFAPVELLAILAVIALLISVWFSAVARATDQTKRAQCEQSATVRAGDPHLWQRKRGSIAQRECGILGMGRASFANVSC